MYYNVFMERDAVLICRLPRSTRESLQRVADAEERSLSNLTVRILNEWLMRHGHAGGAAAKGKRRGRG